MAGSLSQEPDLEVYSVNYTNESILLGNVTRIQPDVILLNKDGPLHPYQLREWWVRKLDQPPVRIIVLNNRNNVMDIYDPFNTQQAVVTDLADLIHWIRGARRA